MTRVFLEEPVPGLQFSISHTYPYSNKNTHCVLSSYMRVAFFRFIYVNVANYCILKSKAR